MQPSDAHQLTKQRRATYKVQDGQDYWSLHQRMLHRATNFCTPWTLNVSSIRRIIQYVMLISHGHRHTRWGTLLSPSPLCFECKASFSAALLLVKSLWAACRPMNIIKSHLVGGQTAAWVVTELNCTLPTYLHCYHFRNSVQPLTLPYFHTISYAWRCSFFSHMVVISLWPCYVQTRFIIVTPVQLLLFSACSCFVQHLDRAIGCISRHFAAYTTGFHRC